MMLQLTNKKYNETVEMTREAFVKMMIACNRPTSAIDYILNNVDKDGFDTFSVSADSDTITIKKVKE